MTELLNGLQPWWPDVGAFLAMGKHGFYVWGSVAACVLALGAEQVVLAGRIRRWQRDQALVGASNCEEYSASPHVLNVKSATKVES